MNLICTWNKCKQRHALFKNTILDKYKNEQEKLFKMTCLLMENVKMMTIVFLTEVDYNDLKKLVRKHRNFIRRNYANYLNKIGGDCVVVEIDECKLGKKKHNKGQKVEDVWVLSLIESTAARKLLLLRV